MLGRRRRLLVLLVNLLVVRLGGVYLTMVSHCYLGRQADGRGRRVTEANVRIASCSWSSQQSGTFTSCCEDGFCAASKCRPFTGV